MARVALDSTVIVTLDGGSCPLPRGKERAESLLDHLRANRDEIVIPAPAFAECCHCRVEDLAAFRVIPLNALGANLANQIIPAMRAAGKRRKGCTRCNATLDALILACAETTSCSVLYTLDNWFGEVAEAKGLKVRVASLPDVTAKQLPLASGDVVDIDAVRRSREPA